MVAHGRHRDLVAALRRSAGTLVNQRHIRDVEATLVDLLEAAVVTVAGAGGASITRAENGTMRSSHATSAEIGELDTLQVELQEGPCVAAAVDPALDGTVLAEDLAGEDAARWPTFAPRAVEAGFRSMLTVQLASSPAKRSALNLYAAQPHAFTAADRHAAGLFALQAAMLIYGAEQAEHLQRAVASRDEIGQAKGILMERHKVNADDAFQMLVSASQDTNMKLTEVAHWLVTEGVREVP